MKRVNCYITNLSVKDGAVLHSRPGEKSGYVISDKFNDDGWFYTTSTDVCVPGERFSFMLCSDVKLNTIIMDEETGEFYNFGQQIITDKLIGLTIRQFITSDIINLDKTKEFKGFILADLEF